MQTELVDGCIRAVPATGAATLAIARNNEPRNIYVLRFVSFLSTFVYKLVFRIGLL